MGAYLAGLKLGPRRGSIHYSIGGDEDVSWSGGIPVVVREVILWSANLRSLVKGQLAAQTTASRDLRLPKRGG